MKLEEVRSIAKPHRIKPDHLSKAELIKTIQVAEGNFDCYATAYDGECDRMDYCWREDCFDAIQQGERS